MHLNTFIACSNYSISHSDNESAIRNRISPALGIIQVECITGHQKENNMFTGKNSHVKTCQILQRVLHLCGLPLKQEK